MRVRHYSPRTEEVYSYWIKEYILFHGKRRPSDMGEQEIAAFSYAPRRQTKRGCFYPNPSTQRVAPALPPRPEAAGRVAQRYRAREEAVEVAGRFHTRRGAGGAQRS